MPAFSPVQQSGFPFQLEYSQEALERVRRLAVEGLLMLPRVGIGVGGLLLGLREGKRIRILDSVEIPCLHARGPSFVLSPEETTHAVEIARMANPLSVVGWYCSKTRGPVEPNDADRALSAALCPEAWQVMILVKPSTVENSRFAVCFRDPQGNLATGDERQLSIYVPGPVQAEPVAVPAARQAPVAPVKALAPVQVPPTVKAEPAAQTATAVKMAPDIQARPVADAATAGKWISDRWVAEQDSEPMTGVWAALALILVVGALTLLIYGR